MFTNSAPKTGRDNGEIRYFAFVGDDYDVTFQKVKCLMRRFDKANGYEVTRCEILDAYGPNIVYVPGFTTVDHDWQLQKTKENAMRLLVLEVFNEKSSYKRKPVWEY